VSASVTANSPATKDESLATGRVLQVNVSRGGVPKMPVEQAWVGRFGLEGDRHSEDTVHGGPHRAVCLFGIEVIDRLQSEGHPIEPGGAGENLTTSGIEWSLMPIGTRARVGDELELELSSSTTPCKTQVGNFSDGQFNRILIDRHPSDSRMYARVTREGEVKPGDPIIVLAPAPDSRAADEELLRRLDRAEGKSSVAAWRAAGDAGFAVDFVEDGEIAMAAAADIPGPAFNQAIGFARLPNLISRATRFFDRHASTGWIWLAEPPPWDPGAEPSLTLELFAADPRSIPDTGAPDGVVIRRLGPDEGGLSARVSTGSTTPGGVAAGGLDPWPKVYERLARAHGRQLFIAEIDGEPVGYASLHIHAKTGWMRGATVAPEARGRGIQRALISVRAKAALEAGCNLVGASAEPDVISSRNLEQMGLRAVGRRSNYVYEPATAAPA
jgi:MOSC domain-containing protein YiiM/GNAT superfamily N-acetyltransferase